jgi:hypothetical protein
MKKAPKYISKIRPFSLEAPSPGVWLKMSETCFRMHLEQVTLAVVFGHIDYPDRWVMRFPPFRDLELLSASTAEEAKSEALMIAKEKIDAIQLLLDKA